MISQTFFITLGKPGKLGRKLPPRRLRARNPNLRRLRGASHQKAPKVARSGGFLSSKIPDFFRPGDLKSLTGKPPRQQESAHQPIVSPNNSSAARHSMVARPESAKGVGAIRKKTDPPRPSWHQGVPPRIAFSKLASQPTLPPPRPNFTRFCPKPSTTHEMKLKFRAGKINPTPDESAI
jgi:hypothetical protein